MKGPFFVVKTHNYYPLYCSEAYMVILTRRLLLVKKSCALCLEEDKTDVFHITI